MLNRQDSVEYFLQSNHIIRWIEILLDTPIANYRKKAIRLIIAPYLINSRKLAYDYAFNIIKNWLDRCDKIKPLDFNGDARIKDALRAATRVGYFHKKFSDLKSENEELCWLITSAREDHRDGTAAVHAA
jgi:Primase X